MQNTQYIVLVDGQVRVLDADGVTLRKIIHTGSTFSLDARLGRALLLRLLLRLAPASARGRRVDVDVRSLQPCGVQP